MSKQILETQNKKWGFWGTTAQSYSKKKTQQMWNEAFETLLQLSGARPKQIRILLDSRTGRHLADQCYGKAKDLKQIIIRGYFGWLDEVLFDDETIHPALETEKCSMLFGVNVYNSIYDRVDVLLYTYKNKNRIYQDYALCMTKDLKKYRIGMDFITPIEEMDEEELCRAGLA